MVSLIIADNHPLTRAGVRQLIETQEGYDLMDEAGDCESCLFKVRELNPDLLLLDLNMPDTGGFDVVRTLNTTDNSPKVVILSMYASHKFVEMAHRLGCAGFVAKEDAGSELIEVLNKLDLGFQMSSSVGRGERTMELSEHSGKIEKAMLTHTELRVLAGIGRSDTSQRIAEQMGVSPRTIDTHRQNISRKLELKGANSLLNFAAKHLNEIEILRRARR